jgi:hypothetical protein
VGEAVQSSACLPLDSDEPHPTKELWGVYDHCHSKKKELITGCHANVHHILLGSTGISSGGKNFMEYLAGSNLQNLDQVNELTFVVCTSFDIITQANCR